MYIPWHIFQYQLCQLRGTDFVGSKLHAGVTIAPRDRRANASGMQMFNLASFGGI
jgi:hypothetical protein